MLVAPVNPTSSGLAPKRTVLSAKSPQVAAVLNGSGPADLKISRPRMGSTTSTTYLAHYQNIGRLLQTLEASSFLIGIPWLYPTKRLRALRVVLTQSAQDFLRFELVAVPTEALQSYADELQNAPYSAQSNQSLGLLNLTGLERHGSLLFLPPAIGMLGFFVIETITENNLLASLLAVLFLFVTAVSTLSLSSERYRRATFYNALVREIMRRRGIDVGGGEVVGVPQLKPLN